MIAPFLCVIASIHDGDTFRCGDGTRIRIAAVDAPDFESARPCRLHDLTYVCSDRLAAKARDKARAMYLGKTLQCRKVGTSYSRIVADCGYRGVSVSCALVRAGVGTWQEGWAARYKMRSCE